MTVTANGTVHSWSRMRPAASKFSPRVRRLPTGIRSGRPSRCIAMDCVCTTTAARLCLVLSRMPTVSASRRRSSLHICIGVSIRRRRRSPAPCRSTPSVPSMSIPMFGSRACASANGAPGATKIPKQSSYRHRPDDRRRSGSYFHRQDGGRLRLCERAPAVGQGFSVRDHRLFQRPVFVAGGQPRVRFFRIVFCPLSLSGCGCRGCLSLRAAAPVATLVASARACLSVRRCAVPRPTR